MIPARKRARRKGPRRRANPRKIKIVVADDQPIDRRGLIALLGTQPDFQVVGDAANGREAADRCRRFAPDVIIMSIRLPYLEGVSAISFIREASPSTHVIALAERGAGQCLILNPPRPGRHGTRVSSPAQSMCTDCLELAVSEGALGTLRRDAEPDQLYSAVRAVARGNGWYDPRTASAIVRKAHGTAALNGPRVLSTRELEVAGLISDGCSNKEIGSELGISEPTVKKHVGHILAKLALQDRLQIGIYIVRNPILVGRKSRRR